MAGGLFLAGGKSDVEVEVETTSKALRVILYDAAGRQIGNASPARTGILGPARYSSGTSNHTTTRNTGFGAYNWFFYNPPTSSIVAQVRRLHCALQGDASGTNTQDDFGVYRFVYTSMPTTSIDATGVPIAAQWAAVTPSPARTASRPATAMLYGMVVGAVPSPFVVTAPIERILSIRAPFTNAASKFQNITARFPGKGREAVEIPPGYGLALAYTGDGTNVIMDFSVGLTWDEVPFVSPTNPRDYELS